MKIEEDQDDRRPCLPGPSRGHRRRSARSPSWTDRCPSTAGPCAAATAGAFATFRRCQVAARISHAIEPLALAEGPPLLPDGRLVGRKAAGQHGSLTADDQDRPLPMIPESEQDHHHDGRDFGQPQMLQQGGRRGRARRPAAKPARAARPTRGRSKERRPAPCRRRRVANAERVADAAAVVIACWVQCGIQERERRRCWQSSVGPRLTRTGASMHQEDP